MSIALSILSDKTKVNDNDDEWIFTLHVPNTPKIVQLRQRQQQSSHSRGLPLGRRPKEGMNPQQLTPHTTSSDDDADRTSERIKLLNVSDEIATTTRLQAPPALPSSGEYMWTYQSPFWNVSSRQLLSITYCPAWQAIPEYTTQLCNCLCGNCKTDGSNRSSKTSDISSMSRLCCWNTCGSYAAPHVEHIQEIFTVADIAKIVTSDDTDDATTRIPLTHIRGLGDCHTIKVYLRPMSTTSTQHTAIPNNMQQSWEKHVRRMQENGRTIKQTLKSTANLSSISDTSTLDVDHNITNGHVDDDDNNEDQDYIGPIITFCVPTSQVDPPLLWKVWVPPIHEYPIAIQTITVLDGKLQTRPSKSDGLSSITNQALRPQPTHIYINGYQSWSFSGSLIKGQLQPGSALPNTFSQAFNLGGSPPPPTSTILQTENNPSSTSSTPEPFKSQYQSDFFTCISSDRRPTSNSIFKSSNKLQFPYQQLDETGGPALLLGWLSQNQQFGIISVDAELLQFQMHCSVDGQMLVADNVTGPISTDWAYAQLIHPHSYDEEPMANYLHSVARYSEVAPLLNGGLLTGWCSWYVYYQNINETLLRDNITRLSEMRNHVPTNVSVVDDGYMTAWGDWDSMKAKDFPLGLATVSDDISSHGMRPGLWLAPFGADKHSLVVQQNPDWVIGNDSGIAANSSYCGKFFYGLDATNPNVRAHVHESIRRAVHDWKFNVLKIDFLYAACLAGNGKYDLSINRAQAMRLALKTIRDAAGPDIFLIGCGCPIASGIGYVDAMRISADTGPTWYPPLPLPWWDNGTLPALRSMIRNSMARAPFGHRWWHNDPDCLMLGSHTSLTDDEVASAASVVAMTCGMLLLSDDLPTLSDERLSIVSKIFPLTGVTAAVLDLHSTNDGLPSLMRLWCTDKYDLFDPFSEEMDVQDRDTFDHNAKATFFARKASFNPKNEEPSHPSERLRSCIHVTKGLGTWTLVSLSNWSDQSAVVRIPPPALLPPPTTGWGSSKDAEAFLTLEVGGETESAGFHVFSFWSSKYSWLANHKEDANDDPDHTVCKTLRPHQTELFHIKQVTPDQPQYLGKFEIFHS
jgi:hypothetical protein